MQKTRKKQHTVPVVYLKRFANNKEQVYVLVKTELEKGALLLNIKDVTTRRFFYDLSEATMRLFNIEDPQLIESSLSSWESLFGKVLKSLDGRMEQRLGVEQKLRIELLYLITLQHLRTEFRRKRIVKLLSDYFIQHSPKGRDYIEKGKRILPSPELHAILHAKIMELTGPKFVTEWSKLNIAIGENKTKKGLMTSDNPVAHIVGFPDPRVVGNLPRNTQVLFPLSPNRLLVLYRTSVLDKAIHYFELAEQDVLCHNSWQLFQCTKHLISSTKDFDFLDKVAVENRHAIEDLELVKKTDNDVIIEWSKAVRTTSI